MYTAEFFVLFGDFSMIQKLVQNSPGSGRYYWSTLELLGNKIPLKCLFVSLASSTEVHVMVGTLIGCKDDFNNERIELLTDYGTYLGI